MSFLPAEDSNEKGFYRTDPKNCRKNLEDALKEEDVPRIGHVKVFLRIKPVRHEKPDELSSALQIQNEHTLITLAPKESYTFKSIKHLSDRTNAYKFSKIFGPETSQKAVFTGSVAPFVEDFVNGTDCLLFAYGPSSAGKTYTMQGNPRHPGLIPRTLDVLFNTIKDQIMRSIKYKPVRYNTVITLSEEAVEAERKLREFIFRWNPRSIQDNSRYIKSLLPDTTNCSIGSSDKETSSFGCVSSSSDMSIRFLSESRVRDKDSVTLQEKQKGRKYSIWVSFAEVYNETVYDLLEYLPGKPLSNTKRNKLKLVNDHNGNTFISDLREVCVMTEDEAYQVMLFGKSNLQFATTKLNHKSSRSHCIFTIKLVQVADMANPQFARINMLTFCDLAGSERVEKSGNTGERLKETGNINSSLLVLGRCLKALRNNQGSDMKHMVPFRESKLTRIFQNSLNGTGNVAMVVNINQSPLLFDETVNVLKYSAVAQKIILKPPEIPKTVPKHKNTRFSVFVDKHKANEQTTFLESSCEDFSDAGVSSHEKIFYEQELSRLNDEIEHLKKENIEKDFRVRRELCEQFSKMMEEEHRKTTELVQETERDTAEYYMWKIETMEKEFEERLKKYRKMSGAEQTLSEEKDDTLIKLNGKIEALTRENEDLKSKLEKVHNENEEFKIMNSNNQCKIESLQCLSDKEELLKAAESKIDNDDAQLLIKTMNDQNSHLEAALNKKSLKIKDLEELLEEASQEYLELENQLAKYQEEESKKNTAMAEMELKMSELISNQEDCDALLADYSSQLEEKDNQIEKLESDLKESRQMMLAKETHDATEDRIAIEKDVKSIDNLNKENALLKESISQLEIMIMDLQHKVEANVCLEEKYESLLNSESKCQIMIDNLKDENSKLKDKNEQLHNEKENINDENLKLNNEMKKLQDENKKLQEEIVNSKFEKEMQTLNSDLNKMCINSDEKGQIDSCIQCDIIDELHRKDLDSLKETLEETKLSLYREESSKKEIEEEKDAEIINLQKAFKSLLQEKYEAQEEMKNLAVEKNNLEGKVNSLESELKESNRALRELLKEKRNDEDMTKLKVFEGSEKVLEVLKEELEKKRETNERLLEDNQSLRDVVMEKEREFEAFSENHEKQFRHYESLLSKLREDIDMHNREEMRLRSLLQMGTPNKYEKSYLNVSSELSLLKKQLSSELCSRCSSRILPTEKNGSLSDVRVMFSNENMAPRESKFRRRSKSQPSYSDYPDYDDDSDFEVEKKQPRRARKARTNRTFTGMERNLNESDKNDNESFETKTPSKSRKLFNPMGTNMSLDLKESVPLMPRTPGDVIKRMLRPRRK